MDIGYGNNAIRRRCEKATGRLRQRLDDIRAAESMSVLTTLPGRYHRLSADRSGQWACSIDGPYRLVFEPIETASGRNAVRLLEVVDYHER
jgi:proteic killer suppression protein